MYIFKNKIVAARRNSDWIRSTIEPTTTTTTTTTTTAPTPTKTNNPIAGNICDDPTFDAVTITSFHDILAFKGNAFHII